jgi:hypothetical protein
MFEGLYKELIEKNDQYIKNFQVAKTMFNSFISQSKRVDKNLLLLSIRNHKTLSENIRVNKKEEF